MKWSNDLALAQQGLTRSVDEGKEGSSDDLTKAAPAVASSFLFSLFGREASSEDAVVVIIIVGVTLAVAVCPVVLDSLLLLCRGSRMCCRECGRKSPKKSIVARLKTREWRQRCQRCGGRLEPHLHILTSAMIDRLRKRGFYFSEWTNRPAKQTCSGMPETTQEEAKQQSSKTPKPTIQTVSQVLQSPRKKRKKHQPPQTQAPLHESPCRNQSGKHGQIGIETSGSLGWENVV